MYQYKAYFYIFVAVLTIAIVVTIYLYVQVLSLSETYNVHASDFNMSGWCQPGKPTEVIYYGSDCPACISVYDSFINITSLFGIWQGDRFYSGYFCAYAINLTAYNENLSNIFAPPEAIPLFQSVSDGRIPLLVFNGEFYKIGGYTTNSTADASILKYICATINSSAPECQ